MHASLADVIADTAQNSIEAGASRVTVGLVEDGRTISVVIADNGKGMDAATHPTRSRGRNSRTPSEGWNPSRGCPSRGSFSVRRKNFLFHLQLFQKINAGI